jgi:lipoprotein-anchoring transpeptidase ErfK/SrfK
MKQLAKFLQPSITGAILCIGVVFFWFGNVFWLPALQYTKYHAALEMKNTCDTVFVSEKELISLRQKAAELSRRLNKLTPGDAFLIINTSENTFTMYKNNQVVRRGVCSTGSFIELLVDSTRSYRFETPRGALKVRGKITNPVWQKPDWAFIEEGLPVPPQNHPSRYEKNVLGDYALSLGNGYLIHGTLYQRFLGMPVTHGCVRLGDEDLEAVYKTLQVGSKVFIF